jgi:hypothetical protein
MLLKDWVLEKLERIKEEPKILVIDPFFIFPGSDTAIKKFADENGFILIAAATNLVFRELFLHAQNDEEKNKILLIDQTPPERRIQTTSGRAPALFYPDFLEGLPEDACIIIDIQKFLIEKTGDPLWPKEANDRGFARLILKNIDGVLKAHKNLRNADEKRFSDSDFKTIVAYACLGMGDSAFKRLDAEHYWKIGLVYHGELKVLSSLTPEILLSVKRDLASAPKPFSWFGDDAHDPDVLIRGFYLSLILSQHIDDWQSVLPSLDPSVKEFVQISTTTLADAAPKLIQIDIERAKKDLNEFEDSLNTEMLSELLLKRLRISEPSQIAETLRREQYSILVRSLSLLMAVRDILSQKCDKKIHDQIHEVLFNKEHEGALPFVDQRDSISWDHLRDAYGLAYDLLTIRNEMQNILKLLRVKKPDTLSYSDFWDIWARKRINRTEYLISALERIVHYGDEMLLPRQTSRLPKEFSVSLQDIRERMKTINDTEQKNIDELNTLFQDIVKRDYPGWVQGTEKDLVLTSQFISKCVKPHWDPVKEKAVLLIFDGMRYDIWDEMVKPALLESMKMTKEWDGCSLLPSETHISRKAISAGAFPDSFNMGDSENSLLKQALAREFSGYTSGVEVVQPDGLGTGQTVKYRAHNLDIIIFEFFDTDLHGIGTKTVGGRDYPSRPLALQYKRMQEIIRYDVMAVVQKLGPGTKVFIAVDHGFGRIPRGNPIYFEDRDLASPYDCTFLHCLLPTLVKSTNLPPAMHSKIIEFSIKELRLPEEVVVKDKNTQRTTKVKYRSMVFPRVGNAFRRPGGRFDPDAYSHGGISMQEMIIPMALLEIKRKDKEGVMLELTSAPSEVYEGEEVQFRVLLHNNRTSKIADEELRIDLSAQYSKQPDNDPLKSRVVYVAPWGTQEEVFHFVVPADEATAEERGAGFMTRMFSVTATYREGSRYLRRNVGQVFTIRLNTERIVRRVGNLGTILGLTSRNEPKKMDLQ